jgi:hypothetical protein
VRGAPGNRSGLLPLARLPLTAATTSLSRDRRGRPGIMVQGNCTGTTHAFSVRTRRRRHPARFSRSGVRTPRPSTASRPASRDDRERPSSGRDMRTIVLERGKCQVHVGSPDNKCMWVVRVKWRREIRARCPQNPGVFCIARHQTAFSGPRSLRFHARIEGRQREACGK